MIEAERAVDCGFAVGANGHGGPKPLLIRILDFGEDRRSELSVAVETLHQGMCQGGLAGLAHGFGQRRDFSASSSACTMACSSMINLARLLAQSSS